MITIEEHELPYMIRHGERHRFYFGATHNSWDTCKEIILNRLHSHLVEETNNDLMYFFCNRTRWRVNRGLLRLNAFETKHGMELTTFAPVNLNNGCKEFLNTGKRDWVYEVKVSKEWRSTRATIAIFTMMLRYHVFNYVQDKRHIREAKPFWKAIHEHGISAIQEMGHLGYGFNGVVTLGANIRYGHNEVYRTCREKLFKETA